MDYFTIRTFLDGMLCMMLLYTFITYLWQRKSILVYYAFYLISILLYLKSNDLYHFSRHSDVPQRVVDMYDFAFGTIECISFNLYGRFAIEFMDLRKHDRLTVRVINAIAILSAFSIIFLGVYLFDDIISDDAYRFYKIYNRYALITLAIIAIWRILLLRNRVVNFFILGSLFYVSSMIVAVVMSQTYYGKRVPGQIFTYPMLPTEILMIFETICFTIGFTVLNRRTELEKLLFQEQLVEQLLENEKKQQKLQLIRDDIARDLHDEVGSDLSALSIMSDVGIRQADIAPGEVKSTLKAMGKVSRNILSTMREIVWSLDSTQDSVGSMGERMEEIAGAMFAYTSIKPHIDMPRFESVWAVQPNNRRDLLLIYKEILHNAVKHSQATNVFISLYLDAETVVLNIEDDGVGFDTHSGNGGGNGLKNIKQRSDKFAGTLSIRSEPGKGTTTKVNCPIQKFD